MKIMKITTLLNSYPAIRYCQLRFLSQSAAKVKENTDDRNQAWQIHSYGGLDELKLHHVRTPQLVRPNDVIVKVDAASVNPIDVAMIGGYGSKTFNLLRKIKNYCGRPYSDIEFPLTLGRDFSGTVISKGHGVEKFSIGDQVWGVVPIEQQGCHASSVLVDSCLVNLHPKNLSHIESAGILYAGLTAWSALWYTGGLCYKTAFATKAHQRILVLGSSGGVGTIAVQLIKAWNMQVVATCNTDAVEMLENLGADIVVDYKDPDADSKIISEGPYDIILDCCKQGSDKIKEKGYPHSTFISYDSPVLRNVDEYGLIGGAAKNISDLLVHNIPTKQQASCVKWGFFIPSSTGINAIQEFVESQKIKPVIHEVFPFEDLPRAYEKVSEGHLRGKIIIDMR